MSAKLHPSHIRPEDSEELQEALAEAKLPPVEFGPGCSYRRYADADGRTMGFGGTEGRGPDRLVRSVVVLPEFRGRGFGARIVRDLEGLAAEDGALRLHLLTTTAAPFFEKLGWEPRERMSAPVAIAVTTEFTTLCPASARYLVKAVGAAQTTDPFQDSKGKGDPEAFRRLLTRDGGEPPRTGDELPEDMGA